MDVWAPPPGLVAKSAREDRARLTPGRAPYGGEHGSFVVRSFSRAGQQQRVPIKVGGQGLEATRQMVARNAALNLDRMRQNGSSGPGAVFTFT